MEFSLSQTIGLASTGGLIVMALGFSAYAAKRVSYIFRGSLRTIVVWAIAALVVQTVLLLAISKTS